MRQTIRFNRFENPMVVRTRTEQLSFGVCIGRRNQQCPSPTLSGVFKSDTAPIFSGTNPRNISVLDKTSRHAKEGFGSGVTHCPNQCNRTLSITVKGCVGAPSQRDKTSVAEGTPCTWGADKRNEGSTTRYTSRTSLIHPLSSGRGWTIRSPQGCNLLPSRASL